MYRVAAWRYKISLWAFNTQLVHVFATLTSGESGHPCIFIYINTLQCLSFFSSENVHLLFICRYYITRGKIVSKIIKYPQLVGLKKFIAVAPLNDYTFTGILNILKDLYDETSHNICRDVTADYMPFPSFKSSQHCLRVSKRLNWALRQVAWNITPQSTILTDFMLFKQDDYRQAVVELDEKEFTSLRLCCCELRNHYVCRTFNYSSFILQHKFLCFWWNFIEP